MSGNIKCMIVDDEPLAIQLLEGHILQTPDLEVVQTATNPIDAIQYLKSNVVDLLFLDIQMPILTGIEMLKTLNHPPVVIFTTAYREYAVESYELRVLDYIVKPITYLRFLKSINKYFDLKYSKITPSEDAKIKNKIADKTAQDSIYVNVNKRYVKVVFSDILYVESIKDYVHIHTGQDCIVTKDKISKFAQKLPAGFLRIHRSFIVNRIKITAFTSHDVEIDKKEIPIGQSYKNEVLDALKV